MFMFAAVTRDSPINELKHWGGREETIKTNMVFFIDLKSFAKKSEQHCMPLDSALSILTLWIKSAGNMFFFFFYMYSKKIL